MAKISNVNVTETWEYDELLPILQDAFRVLYVSYSNIVPIREKCQYQKPVDVKRWYLEDILTNDLVKGTKDIEKQYEYRLQKQQEDFETNSKIDISVLYSLKFGDNSNDLKIECKRLDNIGYIVNDGIKSFKNNKYSEKLRLAGMLLYNIKNPVNNNITLLNKRIENKIGIDEILKQTKFINGYNYSYFSKHQRIENDTIDLYSYVFDYSQIIKNK